MESTLASIRGHYARLTLPALLGLDAGTKPPLSLSTQSEKQKNITMAKGNTETDTPVETPVVTPVDPRQEAWDAFLAKAEKANPTKFAARKAAGELEKIPDNF